MPVQLLCPGARGSAAWRPRLLAGAHEQAPAAAAKATRADRQARDLAPVLTEMRAAGCRFLASLSTTPNARGLPSPFRPGAWGWDRSAVNRILRRPEAPA